MSRLEHSEQAEAAHPTDSNLGWCVLDTIYTAQQHSDGGKEISSGVVNKDTKCVPTN